MRLTFLLPRYGWRPSGGFTVVYEYAARLAARGHDVTVVHPRRLPEGGWPQPRSIPGRLHYAAGRARDLLFRPRKPAMHEARVRMMYVPAIDGDTVPDGDVVIATWWSTTEAALALPDSKGQRFHLIQGYEIWGGSEERVHAAWLAPLRKIFIARWLYERALELGVDPADCAIVPNAINHRVFNVRKPIRDRPARVAMLHSPEPYKGGAQGIAMLEAARRQIPDMTAVLFGVGARPRQLPAWIEYVRSPDAEDLAQSVYNECAVYLCPSFLEGWHLPPAEALACGCALVSTDIGGVRDYALPGETALLFPAGDVSAGAHAITTVLRDSALREQLATRGGDLIRTFTWDNSVVRFETFVSGSTEQIVNIP